MSNPRGGGRRTNAQIKESERLAQEKESRIDRLGEFGLVEREQLRFQRKPGGKWVPAKALYVNDDGSLAVVAEDRGGIHALPAETFERQEVGPRGGQKWVPLVLPR